MNIELIKATYRDNWLINVCTEYYETGDNYIELITASNTNGRKYPSNRICKRTFETKELCKRELKKLLNKNGNVKQNKRGYTTYIVETIN